MAAYSGGVFSLVTILDDALATTASAGAASPLPAFQDGSSQSVEIEGIVVATPTASGTTALTGTAGTLTATAPTTGASLVIQPGDRAAPVSLAVPAGNALPPLGVGARVHAVAVMSGGLLTLLRLTVQQSPGTDGSPQATSSGPAASGGSSPSCPPGNQACGHGGPWHWRGPRRWVRFWWRQLAFTPCLRVTACEPGRYRGFVRRLDDAPIHDVGTQSPRTLTRWWLGFPTARQRSFDHVRQSLGHSVLQGMG